MRAEQLQRFAVILTLIGVSCFAGLHLSPLFDPGEGAIAEASLAMATSGAYAIPHYDGEPHIHGPILVHWAQAAAMHFLGVHEWVVRLPSGIAAALWILLLFLFARRALDAAAAFAAPVFLLGAVQVSTMARAATADAFLSLFITGALLAWWRYFESHQRGWLLVAYAAMALGFLAGGLIAVLIPVGTVALFAWTTGNFRATLRASVSWAGIAIFAAVAMPWQLYALSQQGMTLFAPGMGETAERSGSILSFLPVLLLGLLPFTAVLIHTLRFTQIDRRLPLARFCMVWFVATVVLVMLLPAQAPGDIVHAYPALALLMARRLPDLRHDHWLVLPGLMLLSFLVLLPWLLAPAALLFEDPFTRLVLAQAYDDLPVGFTWAIFSGALILGLLMIAQTLTRETKIAVTALVVLVLLNFILVPTAGRVMQGPVREAAHRSMESGEEVVMWGVDNPSFAFYRGEFTRTSPPVTGELVFTRMPMLLTLPGSEVVYQRNGYALARILH